MAFIMAAIDERYIEGQLSRASQFFKEERF